MDYLDIKKERRHDILLLIGYVLIAVAIGIATLILLYQAYGFGLNKDGKVIQNGLIFFSSHPAGADIYLNNQKSPSRTNSRLALPADNYQVRLTRNGYHDWQRPIELFGGSVLHYDYPFLIPKNLTTRKIFNFSQPPGLITQSPDHRWLLVQQGEMANFKVFDLENPAKVPLDLVLPPSVLTAANEETWQLVSWAGDNQRVLLQHLYDGKSEYILINRDDPAATINLNTALSINPTKLSLIDKKYDQYYVYNADNRNLQRLSLRSPEPEPVLQRVLEYQAYGNNTLLYVTDSGAPAGKVYVRLRVGTKVSTIRQLAANSQYVIDLTKYSGDMYVAVGSTADNRVFIYKDPAGQLANESSHPPLTSQVLRVPGVNHLSFSASAQFIMAQNANHLAVYDIENKEDYNYVTAQPIDTPQPYASWMDGHRLMYVSGGKLTIFDYDNLNAHTLAAGDSRFLPAFDPDYKYVYLLAPINGSGQFALNQTMLVTPTDL